MGGARTEFMEGLPKRQCFEAEAAFFCDNFCNNVNYGLGKSKTTCKESS